MICSASHLTGFYMMGTLVVKRLTIFIKFSDFLTFSSSKETIDVIMQYMSAYLYFRSTLNRLFNKLYKVKLTLD